MLAIPCKRSILYLMCLIATSSGLGAAKHTKMDMACGSVVLQAKDVETEVPNVSLKLYPTSKSGDCLRHSSSFLTSTKSDEHGNFVFESLEPGNYCLLIETSSLMKRTIALQTTEKTEAAKCWGKDSAGFVRYVVVNEKNKTVAIKQVVY